MRKTAREIMTGGAECVGESETGEAARRQIQKFSRSAKERDRAWGNPGGRGAHEGR
jgi:hypothetical protein